MALQAGGADGGATGLQTGPLPIFLGSVTITAGTTTTYTIGASYNQPFGLAIAPTIQTGFDDDTCNGQNELFYGNVDSDTGDPYTGIGDSANPTFTVGSNVGPIPEPSSMLLCGFALSGLGYGAWRRREGREDCNRNGTGRLKVIFHPCFSACERWASWPRLGPWPCRGIG